MKFRRKKTKHEKFWIEISNIAPSSGENLQKFDIFVTREVAIFGNSKFPTSSFFSKIHKLVYVYVYIDNGHSVQTKQHQHVR